MTTITDLAFLLAGSKRLVVFTGAGISTESGIPDFRSPGGVWSKMQPIDFNDFLSSRETRREAWNRVFSNSAGWVGAEPNMGHRAVARLVQDRPQSLIVTQNVDNLHQDAGTPPERIVELHGNASYAKCLHCGTRHDLADLRPRWERDEDLTCTRCGFLVKTATVSFGQPLPEAQLRQALEASRRADLFLVVGSSLVVNPAATLPAIAKQAGADLVIVNRDPTPLDGIADLRITESIGSVLTATLAELDTGAQH